MWNKTVFFFFTFSSFFFFTFSSFLVWRGIDIFRNLVFTWKSLRFSKIVRERFHENKSWHKIAVIGFSEGKNLNYFVKAWKALTS